MREAQKLKAYQMGSVGLPISKAQGLIAKAYNTKLI